MPSYNWKCLICQSTVSANLQRCGNCGCPCNIRGQDIDACREKYKRGEIITLENLPDAMPTHRPDGSNIIDTPTLIESSYKIILFIAAAILFVYHNKVSLYFSRRSTQHLELIGTYSSFFAAMSFLALAASFLSIVLDHFDRRNNEHKYELFTKIATHISFALLLIAVLIAASFEKIIYIKN